MCDLLSKVLFILNYTIFLATIFILNIVAIQEYFFTHFLRISLPNINILKRIKLDLIELIKLYNTNRKKLLLNLINILKSATKMLKKDFLKKCLNFF